MEKLGSGVETVLHIPCHILLLILSLYILDTQ